MGVSMHKEEKLEAEKPMYDSVQQEIAANSGFATFVKGTGNSKG